MHNKDKLHKKYLNVNVKIPNFYNKVLHVLKGKEI